MSVIGSLFGRSPIRPMQQHMQAATECAREIPSLLDAMASGDLAALHDVRARVEEMIAKLNELESKADECGQDALRALFAIEDEIGVSAYYWYEIIRWIGDIADHAERAGNRIRLLIAS